MSVPGNWQYGIQNPHRRTECVKYRTIESSTYLEGLWDLQAGWWPWWHFKVLLWPLCSDLQRQSKKKISSWFKVISHWGAVTPKKLTALEIIPTGEPSQKSNVLFPLKICPLSKVTNAFCFGSTGKNQFPIKCKGFSVCYSKQLTEIWKYYWHFFIPEITEIHLYHLGVAIINIESSYIREV